MAEKLLIFYLTTFTVSKLSAIKRTNDDVMTVGKWYRFTLNSAFIPRDFWFTICNQKYYFDTPILYLGKDFSTYGRTHKFLYNGKVIYFSASDVNDCFHKYEYI